MDNIGIIFILLFIMFALQSFGAFFQVRSYRRAIARCRKLGTLGFGQKKSRLIIKGNIVIIGCDDQGIITGGEKMEGATLIARFRTFDTLLDRPMVGESIYDYLAEFRAMPNKQQKYYKGYIQALEALEMRFQHAQEKSAESEDYEYTGEEEFDIDDL
jgi:DNA-binding transcriptional regulator of glucitol operon